MLLPLKGEQSQCLCEHIGEAISYLSEVALNAEMAIGILERYMLP